MGAAPAYAEAASQRPSVRSASGGDPALTVALDLAFLLQLGQHAIEVIRFDPHLLGDLRDRDPGRALHELERLVGARGAAAAATRTPRPTGGGGRRRSAGAACRCSARAPGPTSRADQRSACGLELRDLLLSSLKRESMSLTVLSRNSVTVKSPCALVKSLRQTCPCAQKNVRRPTIQQMWRYLSGFSRSAFNRSSDFWASRSDAAPTITRLATVPRRPPGGVKSFMYSNRVAPSPSAVSS